MLKKRLIPTVLFKDHALVKSIQFANLRMLGNPIQTIKVYNSRNVDELVFLDIGASHDAHDPLFSVISEITEECFMPVTVGGGIKTLDHIRKLLQIGADKVSLNTHGFTNKNLVRDAANKFGSQAIVISIDAKKIATEKYEVYINGGTVPTGTNIIDWVKEAQQLGAGEILITSIDEDGKMSGYDLSLIRLVSSTVSIPVIASGGAGKPQHFVDAIVSGADAVAAASIFHYTQNTSQSIKTFLHKKNIPVRL